MKRKTVALMTACAISLSACGNNTQTVSNDDMARITELEQKLAELEKELEEVKAEQKETVSSEPDNSDSELFDEIVEELDQYIANRDFEMLFSEYSTYQEMYPELSDELEEKEIQYAEQIISIFDEWIVAADELAIADDIINAEQKLDDITAVTKMKYHFEELDDYNDICHDRLSYYASYWNYDDPENLMGKEFDIGDGGYYRDKSWSEYRKFEDRYGNSYDNEFYEFIVSQGNMENRRPYVIFNADGDYDMFHASLTCHNGMTEDKVFHVEVYGDGTLLYTSDSFSSYNEPFGIDVDITGCKLIKFVAVREDYNLSFATKQPSVAMYEVSISRTGTPEFEHYIPQK